MSSLEARGLLPDASGSRFEAAASPFRHVAGMRRALSWLASAALAVLAPAARAQPAAASAQMPAAVVVAITDRTGTLGVLAHGYADIKAKRRASILEQRVLRRAGMSATAPVIGDGAPGALHVASSPLSLDVPSASSR